MVQPPQDESPRDLDTADNLAVLFDVDGTLVTKDKVLTPRAAAAVEALRSNKTYFTSRVAKMVLDGYLNKRSSPKQSEPALGPLTTRPRNNCRSNPPHIRKHFRMDRCRRATKSSTYRLRGEAIPD